MKPAEVLSELKNCGIDITQRTLQNYEKWGLIPTPQRGSAGRGRGKFTDYPESTVAEAYAARTILQNDFYNLSVEAIRIVRTMAYSVGNGPVNNLTAMVNPIYRNFDFVIVWKVLKAIAEEGIARESFSISYSEMSQKDCELEELHWESLTKVPLDAIVSSYRWEEPDGILRYWMTILRKDSSGTWTPVREREI